jgi:hypothetical protein
MTNEERRMISCKDVRRRIAEPSSLRSEAIPEPIRAHLAQCPTCSGELAVLRLERGILTAAAEGPTPPDGFAEGVQSALSRRASARLEPDPWRPAWGLVPAFAATAVVLLLLLQTAPELITPAGLLPTEGLSASEQLVLGTSRQPDMDQILTAVLDQAEP